MTENHQDVKFVYLKTGAGRVALLFLGTLGGGGLSARALAARRLSFSTGHCDGDGDGMVFWDRKVDHGEKVDVVEVVISQIFVQEL